MVDKIINNIHNLEVSSNEMMINVVLNRSFKRLFQNDMNLMGNSLDVYNAMYRVLPYDSSKIYQKNDLVWFVDFYLSPKNEKAYANKLAELSSDSNATEEDYEEAKDNYYTVSLYLLRSLYNNNTTFPKREFVDMIPVFDASGWKNENPAGTIYTDYFDEFTTYNLKQTLEELHQSSKKYHKFGELSSLYDLSSVALYKDLSNLDSNRECFFCPNETREVEPTKTIVSGSVRKWDCGLLEYDLIFKLGDSTSLFASYNADGSENMAEELDANYLDLATEDLEGTEYTAYTNRRYYFEDSDSDIFNLSGGVDITKNELVQRNVNGVLNSYYGTIKFPENFIDINYAIFPSNIPSAILSGGTELETNMNQIVFIKKSRASVTAILVIPNYTTGTAKVLGANRFRAQIVGRWK